MTETPYQEIRDERARQDQQWGGSAHDATHPPSAWLRYIEKQIKKVRTGTEAQKRERFVKIAALSVAALETCRALSAKRDERERR
jgi:hypothetical protein